MEPTRRMEAMDPKKKKLATMLNSETQMAYLIPTLYTT
jgi:hypothetical protein